MSQQENNNLQDDTAPAQGIGVGGYMAAGTEATPSPIAPVHIQHEEGPGPLMTFSQNRALSRGFIYFSSLNGVVVGSYLWVTSHHVR